MPKVKPPRLTESDIKIRNILWLKKYKFRPKSGKWVEFAHGRAKIVKARSPPKDKKRPPVGEFSIGLPFLFRYLLIPTNFMIFNSIWRIGFYSILPSRDLLEVLSGHKHKLCYKYVNFFYHIPVSDLMKVIDFIKT